MNAATDKNEEGRLKKTTEGITPTNLESTVNGLRLNQFAPRAGFGAILVIALCCARGQEPAKELAPAPSPESSTSHRPVETEKDKRITEIQREIKELQAGRGKLIAELANLLPDATVSIDNLKQLAAAMHAYHGKNMSFPPPAIYSQDGTPLLSWRVAILPYLRLVDNPYKEFKLDEAWDSEHNKKALAKMPAVFAMPGKKVSEPYATYYQVFTGKDTIFTGQGGTRLVEIMDGTHYTFLIVEGGEPVPWTKPEDIPYDADKPLPNLGGIFMDGFHAAFADGSVCKVPEATIRAFITPRGGDSNGRRAPMK